jgi:hypothetical protein
MTVRGRAPVPSTRRRGAGVPTSTSATNVAAGTQHNAVSPHRNQSSNTTVGSLASFGSKSHDATIKVWTEGVKAAKRESWVLKNVARERPTASSLPRGARTAFFA